MIQFLTASPQTKRQLAEKAGITTREVELLIQAARLEGAPICSDDRGYWLGTALDVETCARRLRSRYVTQAVTARALRRTARRMAERDLFASYSVPYDAPSYVVGALEGDETARIDVRVVAVPITNTMCDARCRATTSMAGVPRLEVVAP